MAADHAPLDLKAAASSSQDLCRLLVERVAGYEATSSELDCDWTVEYLDARSESLSLTRHSSLQAVLGSARAFRVVQRTGGSAARWSASEGPRAASTDNLMVVEF